MLSLPSSPAIGTFTPPSWGRAATWDAGRWPVFPSGGRREAPALGEPPRVVCRYRDERSVHRFQGPEWSVKRGTVRRGATVHLEECRSCVSAPSGAPMNGPFIEWPSAASSTIGPSARLHERHPCGRIVRGRSGIGPFRVRVLGDRAASREGTRQDTQEPSYITRKNTREPSHIKRNHPPTAGSPVPRRRSVGTTPRSSAGG